MTPFRDRAVEAMARAMAGEHWRYTGGDQASLVEKYWRDELAKATAALDAYEALAREEASERRTSYSCARCGRKSEWITTSDAELTGCPVCDWGIVPAMLAARPKEG